MEAGNTGVTEKEHEAANWQTVSQTEQQHLASIGWHAATAAQTQPHTLMLHVYCLSRDVRIDTSGFNSWTHSFCIVTKEFPWKLSAAQLQSAADPSRRSLVQSLLTAGCHLLYICFISPSFSWYTVSSEGRVFIWREGGTTAGGNLQVLIHTDDSQTLTFPCKTESWSTSVRLIIVIVVVVVRSSHQGINKHSDKLPPQKVHVCDRLYDSWLLPGAPWLSCVISFQ